MSDKTLLNIPFSAELQVQIEAFRREWYQYYKKISHQKTPAYDGSGKQIIRKRPDGRDYIEDAWMSDRLNRFFPGWSWEAAAPLQFLGSEWVVAQGHLIIVDERLLAYGITPPVRKFYGVDAVRIQYKLCDCHGHVLNCKLCSGTGKLPHTPENIIDVGDNCQAAVTGAKKRAINRLTGIGDDVYGKRVEENGAGDLEKILTTNADLNKFGQWLNSKKLLVSEVLKILDVPSLDDIHDYQSAIDIIKKYKNWQ